jgi:hypothetical protein
MKSHHWQVVFVLILVIAGLAQINDRESCPWSCWWGF